MERICHCVDALATTIRRFLRGIADARAALANAIRRTDLPAYAAVRQIRTQICADLVADLMRVRRAHAQPVNALAQRGWAGVSTLSTVQRIVSSIDAFASAGFQLGSAIDARGSRLPTRRTSGNSVDDAPAATGA